MIDHVRHSRDQQSHRVLVLLAVLALASALVLGMAWLPGRAASAAPAANSAIGMVFAADLAGANEVPPVDTIAAGRAVLALSDDMSTLHYRVMVGDIVSVTAAHIHEGAAGTNGPVIFTLYDGTGDFDPDNPVAGSVTLNPTQTAKLMNGDYYVNVHTQANPGGEVRDQIHAFTPPDHFSTLLTSDQEVPAVDSEAHGLGKFSMAATDTLAYEIHVRDIVSITASHIHLGARGKNGGVVFGLYNGTGDFDPDNPISGTIVLSAEHKVDLLSGHYYVNVHTEDNPGGEIRGQINGADLLHASLSGANEVPANESIASGRAVMALDGDGETLVYRVSVNEIDGISAAHIHEGAAGTNGPVSIGLYDGAGDFDPDNPVSGSATLTVDQVMALLAGDYYVNVHTAEFPGGEIRGQLGLMLPDDNYSALLTGDQEAPPVETDMLGIGRFTYFHDMASLSHNVTVSNSGAINAAHIHLGARGENGGIVIGLYNGTGAFDDDNPIAGAATLTATHLVDLLTAHYYVNVHTGANPPGEIRGQIGGAQVFAASLSGSQEVPPVDTAASGRAVVALSADTGAVHYRVMVNDIMSVTAAHIHEGAAGVNGPVVVGLFDGSGAFDEDNPASGSFTATSSNIFHMLAQSYYVNVHTEDNPAGEIRGQIAHVLPERDHVAFLRGEQEAPPVDTDASGTGRFKLDHDTNILHYNVAITDIMSVTAAHIHLGPAGENGGVVFGLYGGNGPFDADNPVGGCVPLSAENLVDALTEFYYVNVHTEANPGGEIRGQIRPLRQIYLPLLFKS